MTVETMTKEQEGKLVESIMEAIKMSNDGMHPNDAIAKVAEDKGYSRNYISRMVEAFNVSKDMKHRKEASGEAKADPFVIADPDAVCKKLWPDEVAVPATKKAEVWEPAGTNMADERHFDLEHAPTVSEPKRAEHTYAGQSLDILMRRAYNELSRRERHLDTCRDKMASARIAMIDGIQKFADYFRSLSHEPFEKVESAALQYFGDGSKPLMDIVWNVSKAGSFGEKRASAAQQVVYKNRRPYELLDHVVSLRDEYVKAAQACKDALSQVKTYKNRLDLRARLFTKLSALGSRVAPALVGGAVSKMLPKAEEASLSDALSEAATNVLPPDYEAERKAIRAQLALSDLMSSDEVLSKADPSAVVRAYNEVASVAPRASDSPAVLRGILRKIIEGGSLDPYELTNLTGLEANLHKTEGAPATGKQL